MIGSIGEQAVIKREEIEGEREQERGRERVAHDTLCS